MTSTLSHRGPDFTGIYTDTEVALGHCRLAIIDLSSAGNQPFVLDNGNMALTYNGEIYNYRSLRTELEKSGHRFCTGSDTEVLLHSFIEWGDEAVNRFIGMFAFALYDKNAQTIKLVRDRAGVKPLYYYSDSEHFIFGSELKALMAHDGFKKQVNIDVLPGYLTTGYIPAPTTIFKNCGKVPPGHILEYNILMHRITVKEYWSPEDAFRYEDINLPINEHQEKVEALLKDAFSLRMVADVDVGVFLSGGIDSSCVAALLQQNMSRPLKTFTIGFDDRNYDESPYARRIASHLGTDHNEYICSPKDIMNLIARIPYYYDEPFGDSSALPTMLVAHKARNEVKVALSADGGDEAFCGYSKYMVLKRMADLHLPKWGRVACATAMSLMSPDVIAAFNSCLPAFFRQQNIRNKYSKFRATFREADPFDAFRRASMWVQPETAGRVLCVRAPFGLPSDIDILPGRDLLKRMMAWDYRTFMREDVLTKVDRATMSVGLEGREPFLDHRIIEYAARIPSALHCYDGKGKYFIRSILSKYIPNELINRPKMGFQLPLHTRLRKDLGELYRFYLGDSYIARTGVFDTGEVRSLMKRYTTGKQVNHDFLWFIYSYQRWYETWLS